MNNIIKIIRTNLLNCADKSVRDSFQKFFKEQTKFYGVKSAAVNRIAKEYFAEVKKLNKQEIFLLCEQLLASGFGEEAWIAGTWADRISEQFIPDDFDVFERWVGTYVDTWAKCDHLCNHAVGSFVQMYPEYLVQLKVWAKSENRWMRRAAVVSLIIPAKKGLFLENIFALADLLLLDKDDMVQKGYGWLLKEASKLHQKEVFNYVMKNKKQMPRTALRYAIEKMPCVLRAQAMAK